MRITLKGVAYWFGWFLTYLAIIIGLGAVIGSLLYTTLGLLTHPDLSWSERALYGMRDGSQYAGVWAGGLSLVLCWMKGYKQKTVNPHIESKGMDRS